MVDEVGSNLFRLLLRCSCFAVTADGWIVVCFQFVVFVFLLLSFGHVQSNPASQS